MGDPMHEETEVGPVISDKAAERMIDWINQAKEQGASVLIGGTRDGRMVMPTLLENVHDSMLVMKEEAFAPLMCLVPFENFEEALQAVNNSTYGLQAGVYTNELSKTMRAIEVLDVGGVIINDAPVFRVDHMPYGGVKQSGFGREGPRFAVEEMTTIKMVVLNEPPV